MVDWSFNVFNSITVFSVALGFWCFGSQHSSNKTAFSFEAVLMLLSILAAFLSFLSSSHNSVFFSSLALAAATPCSFSVLFPLSHSLGLCRMAYLVVAILSLK